jgi:hypothetical protein
MGWDGMGWDGGCSCLTRRPQPSVCPHAVARRPSPVALHGTVAMAHRQGRLRADAGGPVAVAAPPSSPSSSSSPAVASRHSRGVVLALWRSSLLAPRGTRRWRTAETGGSAEQRPRQRCSCSSAEWACRKRAGAKRFLAGVLKPSLVAPRPSAAPGVLARQAASAPSP